MASNLQDKRQESISFFPCHSHLKATKRITKINAHSIFTTNSNTWKINNVWEKAAKYCEGQNAGAGWQREKMPVAADFRLSQESTSFLKYQSRLHPN